MQPEVRVDSCTSPAAAPERILAPCAGQGLTYNLHEASRCAQPWLQPMHQSYAFNPSWGQQQAMDQSWQQHQHQHRCTKVQVHTGGGAPWCTVHLGAWRCKKGKNAVSISVLDLASFLSAVAVLPKG